ncbi:MAG: hydrophobic/amphiphilic exporter (mainly bacteria), family [Alphaproteobacteria bacterium]|nr:hydrophobic/amphiphilic exporter (mainly bacteria), family [Alphaproteobacteria bacterium]
MGFSHFFVDRPIFAGVLSIILTLVGAISFRSLPVSEFPDIAPPTIEVTATFAGAAADVVSDTVASPIEQEINGVDDMIYMETQSTGDGAMKISVVFKPGTNIDQAQVLVQNRVSIAIPRLPQEVQRIGVTVKKKSPDLMMVIHLISPDDSLDQAYISNYATINIKDVLTRVDGVGDTIVFGARDYSMRVWLDPAKVQSRGLTADDVVTALRAANVQVAGGAINQPPAKSPAGFQLAVQTLGRLTSPEQFSDIIVARDEEGRVTRVRDIGRVELGAYTYVSNAYLDGKVATAIGIFQRPGSNALKTAKSTLQTMDDLAKSFPPGMAYRVAYNTTEFVQQSVNEVIRTLFEAVALVVLVIILFLQTWRAAIIPVVAIPVSLVGTFFVLAAFGFSLNNLTLFGLVLAIGIVVDDAIVVVENVERYLAQGLSPKEAAHKTMDEVGGALLAIALVLCAVFIPTAFITGISGAFYQQFALTIATATVISCAVSLTLSPALAALLLRTHGHEKSKPGFWTTIGRPFNAFFSTFNRGFDKLTLGYGGLTRRVLRVSAMMLVIYVGLIGITYFQFARTPSGFIPPLDRAYFITAVTLPPGSSLDRTDAVIRKASEILLSRPGVAHTVTFAGFDGATFTNAPNSGVLFVTLKPFEERLKEKVTAASILNDLRAQMQALREGFVLVIPPPSVPGIGTGGGFKLYVQDRAGRGARALEQAVNGVIGPANRTPGLVQVFTLFNASTPQIYADIDRTKAEMLGVPISRFFDTLTTYMGSTFVNDFNILGRTYRVTAQADNPFRLSVRDVEALRTRSNANDMVPLGSVATFRDITGPYRVPRYNLFPAAEIQGATMPGFSTGQAIAAMEKLLTGLPSGFGFEWTEIALQEKAAGNTAVVAFSLAVVFVFLLLAAQYESILLPLSVILIVPMCLLAAISGVLLRGMDNNILTQIGFVVLIGLAAKNAILIVEFAKQAEEAGANRWDAAVQAARTRLRPILMTSLAFILGVVPLVIATGAGAELRQALGTAVFFGMLGVTLFGLLFTPVFYVVVRWIGEKLSAKDAKPQA